MRRAIEPGRNDLAFEEIGRLASLAKYNSFTLKVAILKPDRFVTACMTFHAETVDESDPEVLDYSDAVLVALTADVTMWRDLASRLTAGNLDLYGVGPSALLTYRSEIEDLYLTGQSDRPRRCFLFSQNSNEALYSQTPLIGINKPPYANLADASARYIHDLGTGNHQIQFERTLVIALPVKPHIRFAEWLPGELRVQLFEDALPDHQADFFFWRGSGVLATKSVHDASKNLKLRVPPGTTSITGHLLSRDGQVAQSFNLRTPYSLVGDPMLSLSLEQQVRADIASGESDNREMKTFFNPADNAQMRDRVLHSAIALANIAGGRIYIGVEDTGDLSGNSKLMKVIKNAKTPAKAAQQLSAHLRKLIVENTRPVVELTAVPVALGSEWVVRLEIQATLQILTTHTNDIFVRMGASNRRPSADWLEARAARNNALPLMSEY